MREVRTNGKAPNCIRACAICDCFYHGAVMEKTIAVCSMEFEEQAIKTVSLAFELCERKIKENKGNITPELKLLSAAALSLEKVVAVLVAAERLCK